MGYETSAYNSSACWQSLPSLEASHVEVSLTHRSEMPIWTCSGVTLSFLAIFSLTDMMLSLEWHCSGREVEHTQHVHAYTANSIYQVEMESGRWNIPYSGKFLLAQNFAEMCPDSLEEIFVAFIFVKQRRHALTTPLQLMAKPHMRTKETTLNDEAKKQACATTV